MREHAAQSVVLVSAFALLLSSCKDLGNNPPKQALTASSFLVVLNSGASTTLTISGGTPPYGIARQPDEALASATLTNKANGTADLTIQAVSANVSGTTSVKIKDADSHEDSPDGPAHDENEIEITIQVSGGGGSGVSFASQIQPIFTGSCVDAGCHPGSGAPFSLRSGDSYANLVNVTATTGPCAGDRRVLPNNAAASALVKRLEGTCGVRMPLGTPALSQSQLDLIKSWINQGALNN